MAWLSSHSATNKITDDKRVDTERWSQWEWIAEGVVWYARDVTTTTYRYVGMTEAAADSCATSMRGSGYVATVRRENDANGYTVQVTEVTYGTVTTSTTTTTTTTT